MPENQSDIYNLDHQMIKPRKKRIRREVPIQRQIYSFCRLQLVPKGFLVHYTQNESKRKIWMGREAKDMGLQPGFPDLIFLPDRNRYPNLPPGFFEIKAPKGILSDNQEKMRDRLLSMGFLWREIRSLDEAITALNEWNYLNYKY